MTPTPPAQAPDAASAPLPGDNIPHGPIGNTGLLIALRSRFATEPQTRFCKLSRFFYIVLLFLTFIIILVRLGFLIVVSMIFFFNLIFSPILALFAIGLIYTFLWAPQIIRSARRGSRPALRKEYLIGSTAARMFFALCEYRAFLSEVYCLILPFQIFSAAQRMSWVLNHRVSYSMWRASEG